MSTDEADGRLITGEVDVVVENTNPAGESPAGDAPAPRDPEPLPPPAISSPSGVVQAPTDVLATFGKYTLKKSMGAGGMAQIFEGEISGPSGFTKKVVVKTILPEYAALSDFKNMFINEAKVAALLSHPNVVQTFDFGEISERLFIAMEYVDGASLQQVLQAASKNGMVLGPRYAVAIGLAMCEALTYVNRLTGPDGQLLHIVHRDITPGNILISRQGIPKLTDFGVVKSTINAVGTQAGTVKGKYAYMAPEQILGKPVDHRSDLFALGIVMYEIATQRRLFKRPSLPETISAVSRAEIARPSSFIPGFPPEFERILMKAMALDPAARHQTASDLLHDLEAFRQAKGWTSSGRELAGLLEALFPSGFPVRTDNGSRSESMAGREHTVPGMESVSAPARASWALWVGAVGGLTLVVTLIWALVLS